MEKNKKICVCLLCAAVLCALCSLAFYGQNISGDGGEGKKTSIDEMEEGMLSVEHGKGEEKEKKKEEKTAVETERKQEVLPVEQIEEQPVDVIEIADLQGETEREGSSLLMAGSNLEMQEEDSRMQKEASEIQKNTSEAQDKVPETNGENASDLKNRKNSGKKPADAKQDGKNPEGEAAEVVESNRNDIELPIVPME